MREAVPMRWIEQAEAREVLTTAQSEQPARHSWSGQACSEAAKWLPRLRAWLFPDGTGLRTQLVPIPVRCNRD